LGYGIRIRHQLCNVRATSRRTQIREFSARFLPPRRLAADAHGLHTRLRGWSAVACPLLRGIVTAAGTRRHLLELLCPWTDVTPFAS
jgi:hypothetical protein